MTLQASRHAAPNNPVHKAKAGLFAALAAYATAAPAAAATPQMGAVDVMVFKHPQYGCPFHAEVYVSSYATGWPDGDTKDHPVTFQLYRMRKSGAIVKYKVYTGSYKALTEQNGNQTTEFSTFDDGNAIGIDDTAGFHNRIKLIILKPFHWESDWQDFTVNCT